MILDAFRAGCYTRIMTVPSRYNPGIASRLTKYAAFVFCLNFCAGCLMQPSSQSADVSPRMTTEPNALRDQSAPDNGIPKGCTREWDQSANDSLLFCPDIRPPKPQ